MPHSTRSTRAIVALLIWELPLAAVDAFWVADLKRDQLFDLLEGKANSVRQLSPSELTELSPVNGAIIAIWRASGSDNLSPLPQVILGDRPTLDDLFAWSASYLRGLGPITAQARAITPPTFRLALRAKPDNAWRKLAGGAVGAILGEVLMHARRVIPFAGITVAACRGTLSFALMRAIALGAREGELLDVADMWEQVRSLTGQTPTTVPVGAISQVSLAFDVAKLDPSCRSLGESNRWLAAMLSGSNIQTLLQEIGTVFRPLPNRMLLEEFKELTAEARVKMFDSVAPTLVSHPGRSQVEKAFAIALIAYLCRAGMPQQATLLASFSSALPESMVWLGAMQAAAPITDTLAEGGGLGWRVARDLFEPGDIFMPPTCDIALSELQVLSRGKAGVRMIKALAKARLDVELLPGISTFVRTLQPEPPEQPGLPLEDETPGDIRPDHDTSLNMISDALLDDVDKALSVLARFVRTARKRSPAGRTNERKKRR
jgi:hypothetical protein